MTEPGALLHRKATISSSGALLTDEDTNGAFTMRTNTVERTTISEGQTTLSVLAGRCLTTQDETGYEAHPGDILHLPTSCTLQGPCTLLEWVFPALSAQPVVHIKADEGRHLHVLTDIGIVKLTGEQTQQTSLLMEWHVPPGGGVALHTQVGQETFYIVDGVVEFRGQSEHFFAKPGEVIHVPRKVPHAYRNTQEMLPAIMLVLFSPAGRSLQFLEALSSLTSPGDVPSPDYLTQVMELLATYQVTVYPD